MINYLDLFSLNGKVAYVTGGAGLIGSEISKAFASAGAKTVIIDIDEVRGTKLVGEINDLGFNAYFENIDLTDLERIDGVLEKLVWKHEGMDVWVNGAFPRTQDWGNRVEDLTIESCRQNVDMHLNSYIWISRKVCLLMHNKGGGSLINIGSIYGVQGNDFTVYEGTDMTSPMAYSAIKGGIINVTRYLASYFGKHKVRANNVCPGGIFDNQNVKFVENYSKKTPLRRMGNPEDIAPAVLFLASDASSYITGETLMVDGGWTIV